MVGVWFQIKLNFGKEESQDFMIVFYIKGIMKFGTFKDCNLDWISFEYNNLIMFKIFLSLLLGLVVAHESTVRLMTTAEFDKEVMD